MQREELNIALSDTAVVNQSIQQAQLDIIISKIQAAKSTDDLFSMFSDDLRAMFKVQQITLYAVDREKRELFSKFILDSFDTVQEIRVPIDDRSVSGFCARYGKVLNIANVYDEDELIRINPNLGFDPSWDERSGFRTRQILAVPIYTSTST